MKTSLWLLYSILYSFLVLSFLQTGPWSHWICKKNVNIFLNCYPPILLKKHTLFNLVVCLVTIWSGRARARGACSSNQHSMRVFLKFCQSPAHYYAELCGAGKGYEDPRWAGIWKEADETWNDYPPTGGAIQEQTATEGELLQCFIHNASTGLYCI